MNDEARNRTHIANLAFGMVHDVQSNGDTMTQALIVIWFLFTIFVGIAGRTAEKPVFEAFVITLICAGVTSILYAIYRKGD